MAAESQEQVATETQEASEQTDVHPLMPETAPVDPEQQDGSIDLPQTEVRLCMHDGICQHLI